MVQRFDPTDDWPMSIQGQPVWRCSRQALRMGAGVTKAEWNWRPTRSERQVDDGRSGPAFGKRDPRRLITQHAPVERPDPIDEGGDALDAMLGDHRGHAELGNQPEHDLE